MKIVFLALLFISFTYAKVVKSGLACSSISNVKKVNLALKEKGDSLDNIYKYSLQYNCEILNLNEQIKVTSTVIEKKYYQIKLLSKDKLLYCNKDLIKDPNTKNSSISGTITYSHDLYDDDFRDGSKIKERAIDRRNNK